MTYTITLCTADGTVYGHLRKLTPDQVCTIARDRLDAGRQVFIEPDGLLVLSWYAPVDPYSH